MTNSNEDKMNTEDDRLLKYSEGTSYTHLSDPVSSSTDASDTNTTEQSPVQFESRRARRMSETSMMKVIPVPTVIPPVASSPKKEPAAVSPIVDTFKEEVTAVEVAKESPGTEVTSVPAVSVQVTAYEPPSLPSIAVSRKSLKEQKSKPFKKDYWGGTAILTSLLVFLVAQIICAIVLIAYIIFNPDLLQKIQQETLAGNSNAVAEFMGSTPWLLLVGNVLMYLSWLSCMWWVTRYRSGIQNKKTVWRLFKDSAFWTAFKDNFWLGAFKKRDIAYGAGIAAVMFGLQHLVLNVLPEIIPELKSELEASDNTGLFRDMDGISFYLIAFGMGAILGPICEELFFRGFLLRGFSNHFSYKNNGRNMDILEDGLEQQAIGLKSMLITYRSFTDKYRYLLAIIITSILFGLVHFQGSWITCIMTGLLGLVFAITTIKVKRLYPAIFGHIFHNSIVMVLVAMQR